MNPAPMPPRRGITSDHHATAITRKGGRSNASPAGSGATSLTFRKANLKLEVTPQIAPDGRIILNVDINKDSVGRTTPGGFAIDTKHVKTQVLVENGGTVVIGGIFTQTEKEDVNKVPLLGDVPYMGNLFKNRQRSVSKTELLIFLTPKIVTDRAASR